MAGSLTYEGLERRKVLRKDGYEEYETVEEKYNRTKKRQYEFTEDIETVNEERKVTLSTENTIIVVLRGRLVERLLPVKMDEVTIRCLNEA